jgi:ribosomal-protein-alanine N-acetyltransferase
LRLFSVTGRRRPQEVWDFLWPLILQQIRSIGVTFAAALLTVDWLPPLLRASGFEHTNDVIFLEWEEISPPTIPPHTGTLRSMKPEDIPLLALVDQRAFDLIWAYSANLIRLAFDQAARATVIEYEGVPVAYQITTASWHGAHIARLAVDPDWQGQGMGKALVADTLRKFNQNRSVQVTVNTQVDNATSQHLYRSLGFRHDGVLHPFYEFEIHPT